MLESGKWKVESWNFTIDFCTASNFPASNFPTLNFPT